ncbi:WD40 repeat-like protein [Lizonia empirigonia]|nr:WD40 repeat-like protein [Lizonia empirigonia]
MSAQQPHDEPEIDYHDEDNVLDADEAEEILEDDGDVPMDSDDEGDDDMQMEINLQNDSVTHFDEHKDSIFCIAQHPVHPEIIATGGGDDVGYIIDITAVPATQQPGEREGLKSIFTLDGHKDSVNAVAFSQPKGQFVATAGLDGKLRVWQGVPDGKKWKFLAEASEVEEISWLAPNPSPVHPNIIALGANDGSVWVYQLSTEKGNELQVLQAFYLHTESCTAGTWTPDGALLATVSEDSSLYVWDVFGDAASQGLIDPSSQTVVGLTGLDERFLVQGGLYSIATPPTGSFIAVGGPEGQIRIVGLPRLSSEAAPSSSSSSSAKSKPSSSKTGASAGQTGQILASLQAGSDNVETLSFSSAPLTLMAAGNVDGSITLFDTAHRFAVRRRIEDAHADDEMPQAVVKLDFVAKEGPGGWLLTSAGFDGVVRRWDARGGTTAANKGLGGGEVVVTAGDDHIVLVFDAPLTQ